MATEISSQFYASAVSVHPAFHPAEHKVAAEPQPQETHPHEVPKKDIQLQVKELNELARTVDRRLQFVIDQQTKDIIVKVIDANTDKVIRELPEEELQKLHKSIKEALGLLINELI